MWKNRILLASDGSEGSDTVAEVAAQIAKMTLTPITPITLVAAVAHERELAAAEEDLAHKAGLIRLDGIQCDTRVVKGSAAEIGADLVVVGSHRGGLNRMMAGSVVDQVVGGLTCAVLVVKIGRDRRGEFGQAVVENAAA